ncbi:MAG: hypothetical protein EKE20_03455, partial [Candidatus Symbiopectobacterium sp. Dall1.0]|nr:hypothetical protein [Candidatus Symbiopectobacterium sp. Dall1.0]
SPSPAEFTPRPWTLPALTPNVFWVDLRKIDFSKKTGKVLKLDLGPDQRNTFSGAANDKFVESVLFKFLGT